MYGIIYSRPDLAYAVSIELVYGKSGYCALASFDVGVEAATANLAVACGPCIEERLRDKAATTKLGWKLENYSQDEVVQEVYNDQPNLDGQWTGPDNDEEYPYGEKCSLLNEGPSRFRDNFKKLRDCSAINIEIIGSPKSFRAGLIFRIQYGFEQSIKGNSISSGSILEVVTMGEVCHLAHG
ncbi:hypothetical protein MTR_3g028610 [Medicago truncatula]|uniref:Uncharacterized protein n=1 Tax=Medicago truncatula TaxID=3880 RepID=A0A072UV05_MEDTR|nr:hypothetical protein MTR_3g028610 [Medicago truncatula]